MSKVKVECDYCGEMTKRWPSQLSDNTNTYCSAECQNLARRKRVFVNCETCGEEVERVPSRIKENNYCSPECAYEARRLDLGSPPSCKCGCGEPVASKRNGKWCEYIHGHSFRGKTHTSESRRKIRRAALRNSEERSKRIRGAKNPVWRGGHKKLYHKEQKASGFNQYQRRKVRNRLIEERGPKCERCGKKNTKLELHHIDHDLFHNTDDNLLIVCRSCQMKYTAEFVANS